MDTSLRPLLPGRVRNLAHVVLGNGRRRPEAPPMPGVRHRRPRDIPACARLLRVVYAEGQYPSRFPDAPRGWLTGPDVLDAWVMERHGEILGHVAVSRMGLESASALRWREVTGREAGELGGVTRLFVRQRVRRQGIGTALLDVALADIRRRGLFPVLEVASTGADATRLVEGRGWRLLAQDPWGRELWLRRYAGPV
jgi:GNAT superfamily N-acetyltransferase